MIKQYNCIPAGYEDNYEYDSDESTCGAMQNLKITIVPDITIGAGINGVDFDSHLSIEQKNFYESLNAQWNIYKRVPVGDHSLKMLLMKSPEPLKLALQFFANCPDCKNLKNRSLALHILETVCDLCKHRPELAKTCDDNTRMVAFNFIKTCGIVPLYKAVIETYCLRKIRNLLVPKLKDLINVGNYKDAANWAIYLDVTDSFGIHDLIFPLILQEKVNVVEDYLKVCTTLQLPTVQFLDSLLHSEKSVYEACYPILEQYKYPNVMHDILKSRAMTRLITRLSKKFHISENLTPNLIFKKACSYLHYWHHRYQTGGMSMEAWRELARDAATTKAVQLELIRNIEQHGDLDEAVYWAQEFSIPVEDCPRPVQLELQSINARTRADTTRKETDTDTSLPAGENTDYIKLNLPDDCIILVNTKQKFLDMIEYLQFQYMIAFDSEWKPSARNDSSVSVLQLATMERVYLVDCISSNITNDLWKQLGQRIFNNMEILKLGFAVRHDMMMLQEAFPLNLNLQFNCYLDLRDLWDRLKAMPGIKFPYRRPVNKSNLSSLADLCFGKKLDKSNQCSNWSNRPLRRDQIVYAALDAHCLLEIYEVFNVLLAGVNLNIDEIVNDIINSKSGYLFNAKHATNETNNNRKQHQPLQENNKSAVSRNGTQQRPQNNCSRLIRAVDVKLICDSPIVGVASMLRKVGVDTIEVTKLDINYYIALAQREHRFVLTTELRQPLFSFALSAGQIITIPIHQDLNDSLLYIFSALNIFVEKCNYFTRCLRCNSNNFLLATRYEMQLMRNDEGTQQSQAMKAKPLQQHKCDFSDRTFNLLNVDANVIKTRRTLRGKPIKCNRLKPHILRTNDYFFICDNCGTCTWDGEHKLPNGFT